MTSGDIRINGRDVTAVAPADRRISMVFQSDALYPHMTVAENIAVSLKAGCMKKTGSAVAIDPTNINAAPEAIDLNIGIVTLLALRPGLIARQAGHDVGELKIRLMAERWLYRKWRIARNGQARDTALVLEPLQYRSVRCRTRV